MSVWHSIRRQIETSVDEVLNDPRFRQSVENAQRVWRDIEHEVEMIRAQLKENATPVIDDTAHLKEKLDAFRKRLKGDGSED